MSGRPDETAGIAAWRRAQRADLLAARLAMTPSARARASRAILHHLETGFPVLGGMLVGFYWPIRGEFDPRPLMRRHGGGAALPVVTGTGKTLEFRAWRKGARMTVGAFGIPYPASGTAVAPHALIVPLLGFDAAGYRLGYGGGYYDATLAQAPTRPLAIGVGFELGRLPTIHPAPHDIAMDWIVTEAGIFGNDGTARMVTTP